MVYNIFYTVYYNEYLSVSVKGPSAYYGQDQNLYEDKLIRLCIEEAIHLNVSTCKNEYIY